jgi:hypothetical protein
MAYLTVKQLAERVGVSPSLIRRQDAALRPLRLRGRDRRYTEAHVTHARRLLLGTARPPILGSGDAGRGAEPGPTAGAGQTAGSATHGAIETGTSWRDDSRMAWAVEALAGIPPPPDATIVPISEAQEDEEGRRVSKIMDSGGVVNIPAEVWKQIEEEKAEFANDDRA